MRARSFTILAVLWGAVGCTIEKGPHPDGNEKGRPFVSRMEDYDQPGGLFAITPAVDNRVRCPHCGAMNILGQTDCAACGKRLSLRPVWTPCPTCAGHGKDPAGKDCTVCEGRGWVQSPTAE